MSLALARRIANRLASPAWVRWRLRRLLRPREIVTFTLPGGHPFAYPLQTGIGFSLYSGGFEDAELSFVRQTLEPGDTVLDVGANGGIFTVTAGHAVGPTGRVYAFEPGERELEILRRNVAANALPNVTITPMAVSDAEGVADLGLASDGAMNSLKRTSHPSQRIVEWRAVRTTTLDDFCDRQGIETADLIKIDVEGAERLVLAGARRLLSRSPDVVVLFEAYDGNATAFGYDTRQLIRELGESGMEVLYLDESGVPLPLEPDEPRYGKEIYNFVARWRS